MSVGAPKNLTAQARRNFRAFSLVELIVVIGIIALLIALLFPVLGRVRDSANVVSCASNVRQIMTLLRVYAHGNDGRLPYQTLGLDDWSGALTPMGRGASGFRCPADDNPRRDTPDYTAIRSYGINCGPYTSDATETFRAPWPVDRTALPMRLHQIRHHVFLIGDNHGQFVHSAAYVGFAEAEGLDAIAWGSHRLKNRRGDNYGFADGHAEYRLKEELDLLAADPDAASAGGIIDPWKWR